jgi:hypothetical protein
LADPDLSLRSEILPIPRMESENKTPTPNNKLPFLTAAQKVLD